MYLSEIGVHEFEQWIRGILFHLKYDHNQVNVYANGHLVDEVLCEKESHFKSTVNQYLCLVRTGQGAYSVPKFASNEEDYFVYEPSLQSGVSTYLEDYSHIGWATDHLTDEELSSGVFFLPQTNEIIPSLSMDKSYTIIHGYFEEESYLRNVLKHQTLDEVVGYLQKKESVKSYLTGHLQIFDEAKARVLPAQDIRTYVSLGCSDGIHEEFELPRLAQNEVKNSGQLYSLTELTQHYRLDIIKLGLQSVGFYKKMGSRNRMKIVKQIKVFHTDDIPQSSLCQCGTVTQECGILEERICLTCLETRKKEAHDKGRLQLELQFKEFLTSPDALILMVHGNESATTKKATVLDVALVNLDGEIVYESLVKPRYSLSEKVLEMGYHDRMFEFAPDFLSMNDELQSHLKGKKLLSHVMTKREGVLINSCRQHGVWLEKTYETLCLFQLIYYCYHDLYPMPARKGIEGMCEHLKIPYQMPRRASRDAVAILEIVKKLASEFEKSERNDFIGGYSA